MLQLNRLLATKERPRFCALSTATFLLCVVASGDIRAETAVEELLQRAAFLQQSGRIDRAVSVYERVLKAVPNHPDALVALGITAARSGREQEANGYLRRLERAHPKHPKRNRLAHAVRLGRRYGPLLKTARAKARAGNPEAAVVFYRKVFGRSGPTEDLVLEYLQTLGGTKKGWGEAKKGLERLERRRPTDKVKLALAKHLTYRKSTRRQGIAKLRKLAQRTKTRDPALAALRDALLWLDARETDIPMYREFLEARNDPAVAKRLAALQPSAKSRRARRVAKGFERLNQADVSGAKKIFEAGGNKDVESIVGLAAIALREEKFKEAERLYLKAKRASPRRPELWAEGLSAAQFWGSMKQGQAALEAKDLDGASAAFKKATEYDSPDGHHALAGLGFVARARGEVEVAKRAFEAALEANETSEPGLRGLRDLSFDAGEYDLAIELNARLLKLDAESARPAGQIEAEAKRFEAATARSAGKPGVAVRLLEEAAVADPENPWVLHDLVTLHFEQGNRSRARKKLMALIALDPSRVEVRILHARVEADAGRPQRALELLKQIPRQKMTAELARFMATTEVEVQVASAVRRWFLGDRSGARQTLLRIQSEYASVDAHLSAVADGWASIGEYDRAVAALHEAMVLNERPPPGLQLQLAGILLQSHKDAELTDLLRQLQSTPMPNGRLKQDFVNLRVAFAVRSADVSREAGRYVRAFDRLAPLLADYPDNPELLAALGRLFRSSGRLEDAKSIFARILSKDAMDVNARAGAIETSVALGQKEQALLLLEQGLQLMPDEPQMRLVQARYHAQLGNDAEAMEAFAACRRLVERDAMGEGRFATAGSDDRPVMASTPDVLLAGYSAFGNLDARETSASDTQRILSTVAREEAQIKSKYAVEVEGAFDIRQRNGESGLGLLTELQGVATARVPIGYRTRMFFEARPVFLESGDRNLEAGAAARFGTLGSVTGATLNDSNTSGAGAALNVGLKVGGFVLDVGTTPLGFLIETFLGGVQYRGQFDRFGLAIEGSRRSVTDSLLSYGGMRDAGLGTVWGGVVRQGGRLDLSLAYDRGVYFIYGGGYQLAGASVADNYQWMGGLGAEWLLHQHSSSRVTLGLGGFSMGYQRNLSQFSLGHGGYFSPQLFVRGGLPFQWSGSDSGFTWRLTADPGLNWFVTEDEDWFPTDLQLQSARVAVAGTAESATYEGQTVLSFSFNGGGELDYAITPDLHAGARVDVHFAEDYQEIMGGVFLRYAFSSRATRGSVMPDPNEMVVRKGP